MIPLFPLPFLAEVAATAAPHTPPPDQMLSGNWLLYAFGVVVTTAVGAWMRISGKKAGISEATNNITIQHPVPELPIREIKTVTWDLHTGLERRIEAVERDQRELRKEHKESCEKMEKDIHGVGKELLETGHARELRLGELIADGDKHLAGKIEGIARDWHGRMDLQFGPKPRTPRKS